MHDQKFVLEIAVFVPAACLVYKPKMVLRTIVSGNVRRQFVSRSFVMHFILILGNTSLEVDTCTMNVQYKNPTMRNSTPVIFMPIAQTF